MKCTIKNLEKVFQNIKERHLDSMTGADFAEFDDECDLVNAVTDSVEHLEMAERRELD